MDDLRHLKLGQPLLQRGKRCSTLAFERDALFKFR
jgi:hypothetical protein